MSSKSSDLIQLRMKLLDGKLFVSGVDKGSKSVKGLGKATSETATKQRYAERTTSRLTTSYKRLGTAAKWGLGFLGAGGLLAIHASIESTEELAKTTIGLTRNFGLQNNVASRWAAVAQSREIDSKALSMSFGTLSSKVVEAAHKGSTALTPFHRLGISQEELVAHANDTQWALMRVAKALGEEEGGTKRTTAAKALLGKGFTTLLPLFSEGTKGLKEQLHWADKYGVTLSGSTTDGIMEMVQAQRENKVAMLGLQLSLTKALMPAIHAGDDQLQEFIATLNSPHLTAEQKISRISHQFLMLEDDLVHVLEQALPHIAEQGGHLGLALAGALWHGFIHSDTLGKLVIGAWLFKTLGGLSLVGTLGAKVGGKLATSLGWKFLATVAPYFAAEAGVEGLGSALGSQMGGLKALFATKGRILGMAMGVAAAGALAAEIVFAIEDSENIAGLSLFNTPKTGVTSIEEESMRLKELGYTGIGFASGHELEATTPSGKHITEVQRGNKWVRKGGHGGGHHGHGRPTPEASRRPRRHELMAMPQRTSGGSRRGGTLVIHNHLHADGRELAELVTEHALDAAALA
jgi:hypothetical protein